MQFRSKLVTMNMSRCPHCKQAGIGAVGKLISSELMPVRCRACGGLSALTNFPVRFLNELSFLVLIAVGVIAILNASLLYLLVGIAVVGALWGACSLLLPITLEDTSTLNEFRDVIGLLTCLLDSGCVAVYDPQMFKWWNPGEWRSRVFDRGEPSPQAHVSILCSEEEELTEWIHTRGKRKFGRPDLSIRKVPGEYREAVIELINRFIEFQAFGGVIADGQDVRLRSLPEGMRCFNRGSFDDPDFNNVHIEIAWPMQAVAQ